MVGKYLMESRYELGTGLDKHGDGIIESIAIRPRLCFLDIGFKPTKKDFQIMLTQRIERRRARPLDK